MTPTDMTDPTALAEADESAEEKSQDEKNLVFISARCLPHPCLEAMYPRRSFS